ncbi:MAG: hypothetical protein ACMUHM_01365 [Thermoplasmatota archaeon]
MVALSGEGVIDNRTRKRLYDYITGHPGVSFQVLQEAFRMKDGTLRYHLQYLLSKGEIVKGGDGHKRVYYCTGMKRNMLLGRPIPGKINDQQRTVLEIISLDPGISRSDLWMRTKQTRKELSENLRSLMDLGLIWKVRTSRGEGFEFITENGMYREVYALLLDRLVKGELSLLEFEELRERLKKIMK